jgi:hypothetical protein
MDQIGHDVSLSRQGFDASGLTDRDTEHDQGIGVIDRERSHRPSVDLSDGGHRSSVSQGRLAVEQIPPGRVSPLHTAGWSHDAAQR